MKNVKTSQSKRIRQLKRDAHYWASLVWGRMDSAFGNVGAMYRWMQDNTRTGHISTLTESELEAVIKKLKRMAR